MNRFRLMLFGLAFLASTARGQSVTGQPCTAVPGYSSFTSTAIDLSKYKYGSFQAAWTGLTGTLTGNFKLQVSDNSGTNWEDKTSATVGVTTTAGTKVFSLVNVTENAYRVVYTPGGITGGVLNCFFIAKP